MKWISVDEKLPEHNKTVLITIAYENMPSTWHKGYYKNGRWRQNWGGRFSEHGLLNITHWMEIEKAPCPPKES